MISILLVEDDPSLGETLKERLEKEQFSVNWSKTKKEAETSLRRHKFDLALIDVGLPDGSGFDLAGSIKTSTETPIIFVTAMNSAEYRLRGYEIGADEYIPKPFHLKELLLKIRKVVATQGINLKGGDIEGLSIDFSSRSITFEDGRVEYPSSRDFTLLEVLIRSAPRVVSREEMVKTISSGDKLPTFRTVDNSIVRLRQLFGEKGRDHIRAVRGIGYQWVETPKKVL